VDGYTHLTKDKRSAILGIIAGAYFMINSAVKSRYLLTGGECGLLLGPLLNLLDQGKAAMGRMQ